MRRRRAVRCLVYGALVAASEWDVLDLTADREATAVLLDRPLEWRTRVVEQVDIDSATGTLRRRSVQCEPLRPVLDAAGLRLGDGAATRARIVLPVAPVPKGPLLDFDVTGPDGKSALLLSRGEIAFRELGVVRALADRAGVAFSDDAAAVVELAIGFTDGPWRQFRGRRRRRWLPDDSPAGRRILANDVDRYLQRGVAADVDYWLAGWRERSDQARSLLAPFAERPSPDSAVENPVLVVPPLLSGGTAGGPSDVDRLLDAYVRLCQDAVAAADGTSDPDRQVAAGVFLDVLTDYGAYYDLLVVTEVPLDEPFLVKTAYRRPLALSVIGNRGRQDVVIADALSNHVALRVTDPNTRLAGVGLERAGWARGHRQRSFGLLAATSTPQVHSFYGPDNDRDYRAVLSFRVATLRRLQVVPYGLAVVLALSGIVALREDPANPVLGLLVGPAALAASVLFAREPSALGSRLRVLSTYLVFGAVAFLFAVGAFLYIRT